jgi:hypothetical protein
MIEEPPSPDHFDAACWQCGAPARPGDAFKFRLLAASQPALDPLGFPVKRNAATDQVTVVVPRCRKCRERFWLALVIVFCATIAGAILAAILRHLVWPNGESPNSLRIAHPGGGDLTTIVGIVLGFLVGLLCNILRDRAASLRSLGSYPPLFALRQLGWQHAE